MAQEKMGMMCGRLVGGRMSLLEEAKFLERGSKFQRSAVTVYLIAFGHV